MKNNLFAVGGCMIAVLMIGAMFPAKKTVVELISHESKHVNGDPIYNRVSFTSTASEDIWLMQQQQQTYTDQYQNWDRLAIVVNRHTNHVQYYQLKPGALEWNEKTLTQSIPHKVTCIKCHVNGPRAIRPDPQDDLSLKEKIQVSLWNYKIKRYPRLGLGNEPMNSGQPLPSQQQINTGNLLKIKACASCHNDSPSGRNFLSSQHRFSIAFMLENKLMPPDGSSLSKEDLFAIQNVLKIKK